MSDNPENQEFTQNSDPQNPDSQPPSLQKALNNPPFWKQILSDPNVAQYLKKQQIDKYGDKLADSELRKDDTETTYHKRLTYLYPLPEQVSYINALFGITKASEYFLVVEKGGEIPTQVSSMYSQTVGIPQRELTFEDLDNMTLSMTPTTRKSLSGLCEDAIWHIGRVQAQKLNPYRNDLFAIIKRAKSTRDLPSEYKDLIILDANSFSKNGLTRATSDNVLKQEIEKFIQPHKLGLLTDNSLSAFRKVIEMIKKPFKLKIFFS